MKKILYKFLILVLLLNLIIPGFVAPSLVQAEIGGWGGDGPSGYSGAPEPPPPPPIYDYVDDFGGGESWEATYEPPPPPPPVIYDYPDEFSGDQGGNWEQTFVPPAQTQHPDAPYEYVDDFGGGESWEATYTPPDAPYEPVIYDNVEDFGGGEEYTASFEPTELAQDLGLTDNQLDGWRNAGYSDDQIKEVFGNALSPTGETSEYDPGSDPFNTDTGYDNFGRTTQENIDSVDQFQHDQSFNQGFNSVYNQENIACENQACQDGKEAAADRINQQALEDQRSGERQGAQGSLDEQTWAGAEGGYFGPDPHNPPPVVDTKSQTLSLEVSGTWIEQGLIGSSQGVADTRSIDDAGPILNFFDGLQTAGDRATETVGNTFDALGTKVNEIREDLLGGDNNSCSGDIDCGSLLTDSTSGRTAIQRIQEAEERARQLNAGNVQTDDVPTTAKAIAPTLGLPAGSSPDQVFDELGNRLGQAGVDLNGTLGNFGIRIGSPSIEGESKPLKQYAPSEREENKGKIQPGPELLLNLLPLAGAGTNLANVQDLEKSRQRLQELEAQSQALGPTQKLVVSNLTIEEQIALSQMNDDQLRQLAADKIQDLKSKGLIEDVPGVTDEDRIHGVTSGLIITRDTKLESKNLHSSAEEAKTTVLSGAVIQMVGGDIVAPIAKPIVQQGARDLGKFLPSQIGTKANGLIPLVVDEGIEVNGLTRLKPVYGKLPPEYTDSLPSLRDFTIPDADGTLIPVSTAINQLENRGWTATLVGYSSEGKPIYDLIPPEGGASARVVIGDHVPPENSLLGKLLGRNKPTQDNQVGIDIPTALKKADDISDRLWAAEYVDDIKKTYADLQIAYPGRNFRVLSTEGSSAVVYVDVQDPSIVYKVYRPPFEDTPEFKQHLLDYSQREANNINTLSESGLAPKMHDYRIVGEDQTPIITMGRVDFDPNGMQNLTKAQIDQEIDRIVPILENKGLDPGDVEFQVDRSTGKFILVDSGGFGSLESDGTGRFGTTVRKELTSWLYRYIRDPDNVQGISTSIINSSKKVQGVEQITGDYETDALESTIKFDLVRNYLNATGKINSDQVKDILNSNVIEQQIILNSKGYTLVTGKNGLVQGTVKNNLYTTQIDGISGLDIKIPGLIKIENKELVIPVAVTRGSGQVEKYAQKYEKKLKV